MQQPTAPSGFQILKIRLKGTIRAEKEQQAQLQAAEMAVLKTEVEIEKARKQRESAIAALEEFKAWPLECFNVLKDKAAAVEAATKQIENAVTAVESKITELEAKKRELRQAVLNKEAELKIGVQAVQAAKQ